MGLFRESLSLVAKFGPPRRIEREFRRREPWITKFTIAGRAYGGWFDAMNDARIEQFAKAFPEARRIMELGGLEGGHSFALASQPGVSHVLALEGRTENIERAEFVKRLLAKENVTFVRVNLEESEALRGFGAVDAVFCCGLLYHLPDPSQLLKQIAQASNNLFLSTHYCLPDKATTSRGPYEGTLYQEHGLKDPLSGLSMKSFWPTMASLRSIVQDVGFRHIDVIHVNEEHENGPIVTLALRKAT